MGRSFLYTRQNTAYYGIPLFVRPSTPRTITFLTCSPFYVVTYIVLIKGGTSERCYRTRRGRTNEQRYTIISPYFDGRRKKNGPYPEITNISFWPNYFSKLASVWLRRGCLYAWRTDEHNSVFFRRWVEICEWKHEYKVHVVHCRRK